MYNAEKLVEHVYIPNEKHDYGFTKRKAVYPFMAKYLQLELNRIQGSDGQIDESANQIEPREIMRAFDDKHPRPTTKLFSDGEIYAEIQKLSISK
jgi:hypothetical protein